MFDGDSTRAVNFLSNLPAWNNFAPLPRASPFYTPSLTPAPFALNEIPAAANIQQINIIKKLKALKECVVYVKFSPVNQFCMSA